MPDGANVLNGIRVEAWCCTYTDGLSRLVFSCTAYIKHHEIAFTSSRCRKETVCLSGRICTTGKRSYPVPPALCSASQAWAEGWTKSSSEELHLADIWAWAQNQGEIRASPKPNSLYIILLKLPDCMTWCCRTPLAAVLQQSCCSASGQCNAQTRLAQLAGVPTLGLAATQKSVCVIDVA